MKTKFAKIAILAAPALLMLASCNKEENGKPLAKSNSITIVVGNDEAATKAGNARYEKQVASYALSQEGDEERLMMIETVSNMDCAPCSGADTKGTPIYTENFDTKFGGDFYGTAFDASDTGDSKGELTDIWGSFLENGGTVPFAKIDDHTYQYSYSKGQETNLAWPASKKLLYFFEAPYSKIHGDLHITPKFHADGSISYSYADPNTASKGIITNGSGKQTDILFTSKIVDQPAKPENGVEANILLYHSLTAVKFKVGTPDEGNMPVITKVTVKGIYSKGDCSINPNYTDANTSAGRNPSNHNSNVNTNPTKSCVCTTWENRAAPVDYVETFSGTTDYADAGFADSFYNNGTSHQDNLGSADGSKILLLIPQAKENVEFEVEYKITASSTTTYRRSVKADINWLPGEIHTYTFTINKVDVEVDDTVTGLKKTNVTTTNTGNVTAYLRASVVLAWFYGETVVAPYTGTFNPTLGANWEKIGDYYYYKNPVQPGQETNSRIFTEWSAPSENTSGFPNAHLEMKILLQGVQFDAQKAKVETAWGETVKNKLSDEPED